MRVKASAGALIPGLAGVLQASPCYQDTHGQRIYNLDPRRAGAASLANRTGSPGCGDPRATQPRWPLLAPTDLLLNAGT